jgi:hypothetical protein
MSLRSRTRGRDTPGFAGLRLCVLALLCAFLALGAAAPLVVDCLDGDEDGGATPGAELSLLASDAFGPLPLPIEACGSRSPEAFERSTAAPLRAPLLLRAPPSA